MFSIDKQKFGVFIAMLRKEKGITQKELAEQLSISDKAVSKWETGASVPNIDLLVPLADLLEVTVTELLMCQRMEPNNALNAAEVEQVVKTAISYSEEKQPRAYHNKSKWGPVWLFSFLIACLEIWLSYITGYFTFELLVSMGMGAGFGIYFCFFTKEKLPPYYDENRICVYTDGVFEMNLPGLAFNNNNWGKILRAVRIWSVTLMLAYPIINWLESLLFTGIWRDIAGLVLALFLSLGGLFIPVYLVGKKYELAE